MKNLILLALASLVLASCSGDFSIEISDVYVIEPSGSNAAVYMDIENPYDVDETLLSVSVDSYDVQIHETRIGNDGQASMQMLPRVVIPSGESLEMRPGGLHLMILDAAAIAAGDQLTLSFDFDVTGGLNDRVVEVITINDYLEIIEAE
jgi:copper(I)-binding protein